MSTLQFLWRAANSMSGESHTQQLLRSYYLTKMRRLLGNEENFGEFKFNDEEICRKCSTPWNDAKYSLKIDRIASSKKKSRKILRLIDDKGQVTKHRHAKKSAKKVNNVVKIACSVCKNRKQIVLWKNADRQLKSEAIMADQIVPPALMAVHTGITSNTKKRKRNKDKTAGLLNTIYTKPKPMDPPTHYIPPPSKPPKPTKQSYLHQTNQSNANKTKAQQKKATIKMVGPKHTVPTGAKKNSLMHLVNALKTKGNRSGSSSNEKRLQNMLK